MKDIIVIGHHDLGRTTLLENIKHEIILIDDSNPMETVNINGVNYEKIELNRNSNRAYSRIVQIAAMAASFGAMDMYGNQYERKLPEGINIVKEFELIQQKKSRLSKWERDAVEVVFNRNYKKVKQLEP